MTRQAAVEPWAPPDLTPASSVGCRHAVHLLEASSVCTRLGLRAPPTGCGGRKPGTQARLRERPTLPGSQRVLAPSSWCLRASQPRTALGPCVACDLVWPWDHVWPGTRRGPVTVLGLGPHWACDLAWYPAPVSPMCPSHFFSGCSRSRSCFL